MYQIDRLNLTHSVLIQKEIIQEKMERKVTAKLVVGDIQKYSKALD